MTETSANTILALEHRDNIAVITLNRPDANNALNAALTSALIDTFNNLADDDAIDVIVLTGAGNCFCAGVDLKALENDPSMLTTNGLGPESPLVKAMGRCRQPVIGAVNGPAVTGGFELALACDFLYASEQARFADTHARVGILPGWGLSQKLPRIIGINRAREMSLTGNFISAQQALDWGLVNRICSPDTLMADTLATAAAIADADPRAVPALKTLINDGWELPLGEALQLEGERSNVFARDVDYGAMTQRLDALRARARKG